MIQVVGTRVVRSPCLKKRFWVQRIKSYEVINPLTASTREKLLHMKKPGTSSTRIRNAIAVMLKEINLSKNGICHKKSRRCL